MRSDLDPLPSASPSRIRRLAGPVLALAVITLATAVDGTATPSALRHLYLVPAVWAALVVGAHGGGLVGLVAGLLQAPLVLPAMERLRLTAPGIDGLLSMAMPLAFGLVVGRLVDQGRAQGRRLRAVLDLQESLCRDVPIEERLALAAEQVRAALGARCVGLVVGRAESRVVVSAPTGAAFAEESVVGWALREGRPLWVRDLERDSRFSPQDREGGPSPVRGLVLTFGASNSLPGVLAVERAGGLPASSRAAAREMALHLGLAVENARLTLRQRRFTEELEEKVTAATERLRELDQAKTEFLSVVAHELRTPLTALQGFTELLLSRTVPPERTARFLAHINAEAERLGRIVTELLDLSRIETGRPPQLIREPVNLSELLDRNVDLFATQHRCHRIQGSVDPSTPCLHADRDAVDRILKNLISNAVKYSPAGGRVLVSVGPASRYPGMIELAVEDDGVGIPASQLARIFDKYVRVSNPDTVAVRGLGLGLAMVRALAEAHDGCVEVESLPGKGSIFRVFVPVGGPVSADFPYSSA